MLRNYVLHIRNTFWNTPVQIHGELAMWRPHCSWNFVVKGFRHRAMTAPSPRCRRSTVFADWRHIYCLPRVARRFTNGDGYQSKEPIHVSNFPFSHSLSAAVFCVETAHPSSLNVSIMRFSCKLDPLISGIGACTLRAQWTSTSVVRSLRSLTDEWAGIRLSFITFF
jgi:hypothetical protein